MTVEAVCVLWFITQHRSDHYLNNVCVMQNLLFTEVTDGFPVVFMNSEPLTVSRANIDVH